MHSLKIYVRNKINIKKKVFMFCLIPFCAGAQFRWQIQGVAKNNFETWEKYCTYE